LDRRKKSQKAQKSIHFASFAHFCGYMFSGSAINLGKPDSSTFTQPDFEPEEMKD